MKRYIIKSNRSTDTEKDNLKEQVIADIQRNEIVTLEINAVNNETDNILKESNNGFKKTPATEKEYKN